MIFFFVWSIYRTFVLVMLLKLYTVNSGCGLPFKLMINFFIQIDFVGGKSENYKCIKYPFNCLLNINDA